MFTLRIATRVPAHKRHEFAQSALELLGPERAHGCQAHVLQDVDDRSLFYCMAEWAEAKDLTRFMESPAFTAIKGAAAVLGGIEEIVVLENGKPEGEGRAWPRLL